MQAQGGPSRAELWDEGQQSAPDSHLWLKTLVQTSSRPPRQNEKLSWCCFTVGSIFPLESRIWLIFLKCFFSLFVLVGGRGRKKVGEEANFWNVHFPTPPPKNYNIQSIPIAHWSCQQRVKMLSVHVAIKKTNPPCTVLRKYSGGLMRSRGFSSCC